MDLARLLRDYVPEQGLPTRKRLELWGVQCYMGNVQHIASFEARKEASLKAMRGAQEVVREMKKEGKTNKQTKPYERKLEN